MSTKLSGKALVIQLTRDHIRVAKMQLGAKAQVLHSSIVATPAGAVEDGFIRDVGAVSDAIKTMRLEPEFHGIRRTVFALCTTQTLSEKVNIPAVKGQKMDKIMDANMDMYFPVEVSDYRVTCQELGRITDEHGVENIVMQMWAIPKTLLLQYYELADACGLHVLAIDYCGNSHAHAAGATFLEPKPEKTKKSRKKAGDEAESFEAEMPAGDPVSVFLMAEPEMIVMTFVEKSQVRMQRSFLCGYDIDSALSEAMMVVDYYRGMDDDRYAPMEIIVCGTLAEDPYFASRVENALAAPARIQESVYPSGWCCCIGAAQTEVDFGSPDLAGKKKASRSLGTAWHYAVVLVGGAATVLSVMMLLGGKTMWNNELISLQDTEMMLRIQSAQNQKSAEAYGAYASEYQSFSSDWTNVFASLRTYNDNLVLIFDEIEALLPGNSFVEGVEIQADSISLQFSCTDKEEAAYLIMALREMKYATVGYISDLTGKTGEAGRGDYVEAPPTEGGNSIIDSLLASGQDPVQLLQQALDKGWITEQQLIDYANSLSPEERAELLDKLGQSTPTTEYSMNELLQTATLTHRKNAISRMLKEDPVALYNFTQAFKDDMARPSGTTILYETISDDVWNSQYLFGAILTQDISQMQLALPELIAILTKNERNVAATENLIRTNTSLTKSYAYYLALAMGLEGESGTGGGSGDSSGSGGSGGSSSGGNGGSGGLGGLGGLIGGLTGGGTGGIGGGTGGAGSSTGGGTIDGDISDILDIIGGGTGNGGDITPDQVGDIVAGMTPEQQAMFEAWLKDYMGTQSGGAPSGGDISNIIGGLVGGGGAPVEPEDTRIHFSAALIYSESLIEAELERKGFDLGAMPEMLEVE